MLIVSIHFAYLPSSFQFLEQWSTFAGNEAMDTKWRLGHSPAFALHKKLFSAIEAVKTVRHGRGCSTNQRAAAWWTEQMNTCRPDGKPGHLSTLTKVGWSLNRSSCMYVHTYLG